MFELHSKKQNLAKDVQMTQYATSSTATPVYTNIAVRFTKYLSNNPFL